MLKYTIALALVMTAAGRTAPAQELSEQLANVGEAYARAYVHPLAVALGTDLNTGLFHTATPETGANVFNFYFGLKGMAALLPEADRSFDLTYTGRVRIDGRVGGEDVSIVVPATFSVRNAPTIFGSTAPPTATVSVQHDTTISFVGVHMPVSFDTTFTLPTIGGLIEASVAPFVVPHAEIGSLLGTSLMIRWLPRLVASDIGTVGIFGTGIRHSLSQYWDEAPIDLSITAAWQQLRVDDAADDRVIAASTAAIAFAASRRFGYFIAYGGMQIENSVIEFSYVFEAETGEPGETESIPVAFSVRDDGRLRAILGGSLRLGPVILNADMGIGRLQTFSAGLGLAF